MKGKRAFKKLSVLLAVIMMLSMCFVGCGNKNEPKKNNDGKQSSQNNDKKEEPKKEKEKDVTLSLVVWSEPDYEYIAETDNLTEAYKKVKPNVNIEIEHIPATEYDNTMKIRNSANQLPDLFPVRASNILSYKDIMEPLNDLEAVKNNKFAEEYAIDDNVIGIPQVVFNEFVYYRKSVFEEYGLEVPKTWDQFIDVCKKIKEEGKYIPLILGAKDAWTDYPFNEFMPIVQAEDGKLWSHMAAQDEPFAKGEPFYEAYSKIQKLYDAKVSGDDPLGYGWDQAKSMLVAKEGAMMAVGQWYKADYVTGGGDESDLGVFLLPVREKESDPLYTLAMAEMFWGTPKNSKHKKEAKEFFEWYFSSDYYKKYMDAKENIPTVKGVEANSDFFKSAYEGIDVKYVVYDAGNEEFKKIMDEISFDVKAMGQEMLSGRDFDEFMNEMNNKWKKARKN